jgi:hypothetical protein
MKTMANGDIAGSHGKVHWRVVSILGLVANRSLGIEHGAIVIFAMPSYLRLAI